MGSIAYPLNLGRSARSVQGEPADKKLARGDVLPFFLKSVEIGGPQTAFAFLKMWKLASLLVDKGGNYRAGSCKPTKIADSVPVL